MCTVPPPSVYTVEKYVEEALSVESPGLHWGIADVVETETEVLVSVTLDGADEKGAFSVLLKSPTRSKVPETVPGDLMAEELVIAFFI